MFQTGPYRFKQADSPGEFEQIHALNYGTFVREIPQHAETGDGRLVDKFHDKNVYLVALKGAQVVGMLSLHDRPPFSVAGRLPDPAILTRPGMRPVEIRLLAIRPDERHSAVFGGLTVAAFQHVQSSGYTHVFISGLEDRLALYTGLGFEALDPAVGDAGAKFIPMCLPAARMEQLHARATAHWARHLIPASGGVPQ